MGISRLAQITGAFQPTSFFKILNWLLSTWGLFIALQVMCTVLIAGRIWWHAKRTPLAKSRYISIIAVIIESGVLITLSTTFLLAFADLKTQAGAITGDLATQIAVSTQLYIYVRFFWQIILLHSLFQTIAPTLIIIRVELIRKTDFISQNQILVDAQAQNPRNGRREEPAVHITVTTLSVTDSSDAEKEIKSSA